MRAAGRSLAFSLILPFAGLASDAAFAQSKGKPSLSTEKEKISYILGHQTGANFKRNGIELDLKAFNTAIEEAIAGKKSQISPEETQKILVAFQGQIESKMAAKNKEAGEKNAKEGKTFLEENAKKPGVVKLPSGLQYKVIKEGTGPQPKDSDTVTTHYKGTLINGTTFDSSIDRGEPVSFPVGGVIKGWTEALKLMKVGSKWQLVIPSELAYGAQGAGPDIGPNSTLVFEVELLSIGAPAPKK